MILAGLLAGALLAAPPLGFRATSTVALDRLQTQTGFHRVEVERPCVADAWGRCAARALDSLARRFDEAAVRPVQIVVLGDSHIASDYITGMARHVLQSRWGDAGRGLVAPDQSARFGGRKLGRSGGWRSERIVDAGQAGKTFGLTGLALESERAGVSIVYGLEPADREVSIYFETRPGGPALRVETGTVSHRRSTEGPARRLSAWRVPVPDGAERLRVRAEGPGVRLFGLAFDTGAPGVRLDAIGPVGAESQVYLQMDRRSLLDHLRLREPDAVVFMIGGNDALKVRKGWWSLERVERQLRELFRVVREAEPESACLVVTPMDAGQRRGDAIVSRAFIPEVRDRLRRVALDSGCAVWDLLEAMGGPGSIRRWVEAGIINPHDLLHPRKRAADLIGRGFAAALAPEGP